MPTTSSVPFTNPTSSDSLPRASIPNTDGDTPPPYSVFEAFQSEHCYSWHHLRSLHPSADVCQLCLIPCHQAIECWEYLHLRPELHAEIGTLPNNGEANGLAFDLASVHHAQLALAAAQDDLDACKRTLKDAEDELQAARLTTQDIVARMERFKLGFLVLLSGALMLIGQLGAVAWVVPEARAFVVCVSIGTVMWCGLAVVLYGDGLRGVIPDLVGMTVR